MFARVFMRQQRALVALSLFDDDDAKKGVQLITQREERGFRDHIIFRRLRFFCVSTQHKKEQICCFLTHHPGLLEEDAR